LPLRTSALEHVGFTVPDPRTVSPALGDLTQKAMAYSRFAGRDGFSSVPPKLNERR
jgi:hypothetical protein